MLISANGQAESEWIATGSWTSAAWVRERYGARIASEAAALSEKTDVTLLQYGQISASLVPQRRDGTAVQLLASGRLRTFATDVPQAFRVGEDRRMYQGYVDITASQFGWTHVRMGRQFLPNTSGFWRMDGLRVEQRLGLAKIAAFGGRGRPTWEFNEDDVGLFGGDVSARLGPHIGLRTGILSTTGASGPDGIGSTFVTGGAQVSTQRTPALHRFDGLPASASVDVSYEPQMHRVARATGAGRVSYRRATLALDWRYDVPQFPADSIFRVFAVEATREASASVSVMANDWLRLRVRHSEQSYDEDPVRRDRAEATIVVDSEQVASVGFERLDWMDAKRHVAYFDVQKWLTPYLRIGAGNSINSYRLLGDDEESFSRSLRIDVEARASARLSCFGRIEQVRNPAYREATRAYIYVRTGFFSRSGTAQ